MLRGSLILILFASLVVGCGPASLARPDTEDDYPGVVATAEASGLDAYWLGPSFSADGLTFDRISSEFPEGAAGVDANGLQLSYLSIRQDTEETYTIRATLDVKTFRVEEWPAIEEALRKPHRGSSLALERVMVSGVAGTLGKWTVDGMEGATILILPIGESTVFASAGPSITTGGAQGNPLVDRGAFLDLMEKLRPYPE